MTPDLIFYKLRLPKYSFPNFKQISIHKFFSLILDDFMFGLRAIFFWTFLVR